MIEDPQLRVLLAHYVRNLDGAVDVLRDALLDRQREPLPSVPDPVERLELVLGTCTPELRLRVAVVSAQRMAARLKIPSAAANALTALGRGESLPETIRHDVFKAWRVTPKAKTGIQRTIWAVWMLLRDVPLDAMRTLRTLDGGEIAVQIETCAQLLGDGAS